VNDNSVMDGAYGIHFTETATAWRRISCKRNKLHNQTHRGISAPAGSATIFRFSISYNEIDVGSAAVNGFVGIIAGNDNMSVKGNELGNAIGAGSRVAISLTGTTTPALLVAANEVRGEWARTVDCANDSGAIVAGNYMTAEATRIGGGSLTGVTVSGTVLLAA
jgi:hypothetical protein